MNSTADMAICVLLIEDDPQFVSVVTALLEAAPGPPITWQHVATLAAGLERVAAGGIDVILLDLMLPDSEGWDTFVRTHAHAAHLPIIVLSGVDDEQLAMRTVHEGAQDYLVKAHVTAPLLARSIRYAVERQHIEETLAEERNLLRTLIDNLPDLIYAKDTEGKLIVNNAAHLRFLGATKLEEVVGKTVFDYFPRAQAEQYAADEQAVMRSGEPLINREEARAADDGQPTWVLTTKVPLRNAAGQVTGMVGISRDITALKRYEQVLADERNLLRSLMDALPDHIYVKDRESRFTTANLATAQFMGAANPEALRGKTDFDFFPREVATQWQAEEQKIIHSGKALVNREAMVTDRAGSQRWVLTTKAPLRDRQDNIIGIVGVNRDITQRKQAEQLLQAVNTDLARSQRELFQVLTNLKEAHEQLKATQMQLIEAEKMQSVARLAAGVAHEVKNPLAILRMAVDYLETHETTQRQDVAQVLHDMVEALDRADGVIKGLLDFSTPRELQMADTDLNLVIEQSLRLVRHELAPARIRLVSQLAPDLPAVRIDPVRIQQVFINLLTNAAQAMPAEGTLTLRTYRKQLTLAEVTPNAGDRSGTGFHAGDPVVVAEVDDTGPGIPADKQPKLFEPFFTTKATGQGQGLGLTVARRIVELHGGTLQLQNRPEGGARATLLFRATRNP